MWCPTPCEQWACALSGRPINFPIRPRTPPGSLRWAAAAESCCQKTISFGITTLRSRLCSGRGPMPSCSPQGTLPEWRWRGRSLRQVPRFEASRPHCSHRSSLRCRSAGRCASRTRMTPCSAKPLRRAMRSSADGRPKAVEPWRSAGIRDRSAAPPVLCIAPRGERPSAPR